MDQSEIRAVLERLRDVEARVRAMEHHIRGTAGKTCGKCGEDAAYSVGVTRNPAGTRTLRRLRCAMCGHEDTIPA